MIVCGYMDIDHKGCGGWIIVMGFKDLLIIYYLIRKKLVNRVLDAYARGVKIKSFSIQML